MYYQINTFHYTSAWGLYATYYPQYFHSLWLHPHHFPTQPVFGGYAIAKYSALLLPDPLMFYFLPSYLQPLSHLLPNFESELDIYGDGWGIRDIFIIR